MDTLSLQSMAAAAFQTFLDFLQISHEELDIPAEISSEKFGQLLIKCLIKRAKIEDCLWSKWILFASLELLFGISPPALDVVSINSIKKECIKILCCCKESIFNVSASMVETESTESQTGIDEKICSFLQPIIINKSKCTQTQICAESKGVNTRSIEFAEVKNVSDVGCQTAKCQPMPSCNFCSKSISDTDSSFRLFADIGCQTELPWKICHVKVTTKVMEKAPKVVKIADSSQLKVFYGRPLRESVGMQTPMIPLFTITPELVPVDPRTY